MKTSLQTGSVRRPSQEVSLARLSVPGSAISVRLVCFPPTAGGFFSFLPWLKAPANVPPLVPAGMEVWGIQFDWAAGGTYDSLVLRLTDALEEQRASAPLILCGASLGGLLAFGVARELRRRQEAAPLGLLVIAMSAPQSYRPGPPGESWTLDEWRRELRRVGGTPEEILTDPAKLSRLLRQVWGGVSTARSFTYRDEPPFAFPIAVFAGEADQAFPPPLLSGWSQQTTSSCTTWIYPQAGHLDLLQVPTIRCGFLVDLVSTVQHWLEGTP